MKPALATTPPCLCHPGLGHFTRWCCHEEAVAEVLIVTVSYRPGPDAALMLAGGFHQSATLRLTPAVVRFLQGILTGSDHPVGRSAAP